MPMYTVDNRELGDCMYEAYAVSIMYYLRAQPHQTIQNVLGRFPLSTKDSQTLQTILLENRKHKEPFEAPIHQKIQDILGPASRSLAAESVKAEFLKNPLASPLYAVAAHQFCIHYAVSSPPPFRDCINDMMPDTNGNFSASELYRIDSIKQDMSDYAHKTQAAFWQELNQASNHFLHEDAQLAAKEKQEQLDNLIQQYTVRFFIDNNCENLKAYITHIATPGVWGSEETLLSLHRAVQNEMIVNDETRCYIEYETPIQLAIYEHSVNRNNTACADVILNNRGNSHWVSLIPEQYCYEKKPLGVSTLSCFEKQTHKKPPARYNQQLKKFAEKSVNSPTSITHSNTSETCLSTETKEEFAEFEEELDNALARISDTRIKQEYKLVLCGLFSKSQKIGHLNTSETQLSTENTEEYAERIQMLYLQALKA